MEEKYKWVDFNEWQALKQWREDNKYKPMEYYSELKKHGQNN